VASMVEKDLQAQLKMEAEAFYLLFVA